MIKIQFKNVHEAIEHGKHYGGWIFASNDRSNVAWYDASEFTVSSVLRDTEGGGFVGTWREHEVATQ